jgi:tetratricopeptide (TPR) repeat protein
MISFSSFAQYDVYEFLDRGRQFLVQGKYAAAIDNFNMLARFDSTMYDAYFFRGIAKYNLGDFMGAEKDFNNTLRINPIYTPAYHYRAITLSRMGKYDSALKDLAEAVDLRPSYIGLYFSRGVTYFLSQQFRKAILDFNRFIKQVPDEADAYLNRGACYLYLGDTTRALKDYNKAIDINVADPEGYVRRSRIYIMQHKNESAMRDLNSAIALDSTNTFAYFNRALLKYDDKNIKGALTDFNTVLKIDPGNALTLYNRALVESEIGNYSAALDDYGRVLAANPENVLTYFNRAGVFMALGYYGDAVEDYSRAIKLYPDFARAYMNRSVAKNYLGQYASAKEDYENGRDKVKEYRKRTGDSTSIAAFADTTKKYDKLLALDADFAKKDFNNELLQYRDINIKLKPLFKFDFHAKEKNNMLLEKNYSNVKLAAFVSSVPMPVDLESESGHSEKTEPDTYTARLDDMLADYSYSGDGNNANSLGRVLFARGIAAADNNMYNKAMEYYGRAIEKDPEEAFYYLNRGALQSEMIDFISSMESNVQILTLDNTGAARARVQDNTRKDYDYTAALRDMKKAEALMPDFPYIHYNLGNLYCLSRDLPESIRQYNTAIRLYPYLGEAYYNRGLVLIFLKDKEKGCIDISKAGELGITDAYNVINRFCKDAAEKK